jgi:hypothetical protein
MFSMRRDIWPSCAVSLRPPGRARWCRGSAIASRLLAPLEPRLHVFRIEPENVARQPEPRDLAGAPAAQDCLGRHAQELRNLAGRQEAVSHPDSAKRDQSAAPTIPAPGPARNGDRFERRGLGVRIDISPSQRTTTSPDSSAPSRLNQAAAAHSQLFADWQRGHLANTDVGLRCASVRDRCRRARTFSSTRRPKATCRRRRPCARRELDRVETRTERGGHHPYRPPRLPRPAETAPRRASGKRTPTLPFGLALRS